MSCKRHNCSLPGIWVPVLLLRKKLKDDPIRARLPKIEQCQEHRWEGKLEDFLSAEGWDKMQKHLREAGKGRFTQRLTELAWEPAPGKEDQCLPF